MFELLTMKHDVSPFVPDCLRMNFSCQHNFSSVDDNMELGEGS